MAFYYQYQYTDHFILEYHTPEKAPCISIEKINDQLTFFALSNDTHLSDLLLKSLRAYVTEHRFFTSYNFVPFLREYARGELTLKHRLLLGVLDQGSQTLRFINFGMYYVLFKDTDGRIFTARDHENTLSEQPTPFRVQVYPLNDIQSVFFANNSRLLSMAEANMALLTTKKQFLYVHSALEDVQPTAETGSFLLINHLPAGSVTILSRETVTQPNLDALSNLEIRFEASLAASGLHEELADNAMLIFHEMLLNAFEHGVLRMTSEQKQELIRSGQYEGFIIEQEKACTGQIDISCELFANRVLRISISDSGDGFEYESYLRTKATETQSLFHNRGIKITQELSDGMYYSDQGRQVHLILSLTSLSAITQHRKTTPEEELQNSPLRDVSILYVEDDELTRELYVRLLKRMSKSLHVAENGQEGLELFHKFHPDIILSDIQMPVMNGLDMAQEIRQHNRDIPILLITAFSDKDHILSAIDAGVDRFINKPVQLGKLRMHLEHYARIIQMQQQLQKRLEEEQRHREEEFFALKDKSRREEQQQKEAFAKEELIIHNDAATLEGIRAEVFYKPQDILSGDIYGIFRIDERRTLFYIIDSMGKGIGASVTAILSASFINQYLKTTPKATAPSLQDIVTTYADYIKSYLLDDEVISLAMACIDTQSLLMEYSSFGMYPIFIKDIDKDSLHECRTNNLPLMIYSQDIRIDQFTLPRNFHILIYSDGLCENDDFSGTELRRSFVKSHCLNDILQDFFKATNNQEPVPGSDDTSILYISNQSVALT
ncbi:response regulator [Desulfurispirillum indicum]|uniref:response regulator n=1 Tax=Desulfurispirillum indicum TaxID=936456 RepID=UPI001CF9A42E|nr:response regulator [Desulfurispirillum indicum]UCZ55571.1 response regulator [Desulfurispirillum indicum]